MVCYIRYRKLRPELHAKSTFKMPGGVWMSYVVLIFVLYVDYFEFRGGYSSCTHDQSTMGDCSSRDVSTAVLPRMKKRLLGQQLDN